jgi:transmembrane sensor
MPIHPERLTYLLQRYAADNCTGSELLELLQKIGDAGEDEALREALGDIWKNTTGESGMPPIDKDRLFDRIVSSGQTGVARMSPAKVRDLTKRRPWGLTAAASVLLLLAGALYLYNKRTSPAIAPAAYLPKTNIYKNDIAPGNNKAVLTLANGSSVVLDSALNGSLARQGHTLIIKLSNGQLAYKQEAGCDRPPVPVNYNTITVPKGGQYQLVLPDGSRVWLNSASSLRFPTAFTGADRTVELTGEAYFEVQANKDRPFRVALDGMKIDVLGTHFNVMAYKEEGAPLTTLLEGAVKVVTGPGWQNGRQAGEQSVTLAPGEQAEVKGDGAIRVRANEDIAEAVAWKDGLFYFHNTDIRTVMRQLSRWYDIDVVYQPAEVRTRFYAKIPRNTNISTVLQVLTMTGGMHFQVEGNKVTVSP